MLFDRAPHLARPTYPEIAQAVLGVVLVVVFCNQLLPSLLFNRTRGPLGCAAGLAHPPAAVADDADHGVHPLLLLRGVAGRRARQPKRRKPRVDVEALLEAGEEEGILEESDRDLVRSAVEFGDKLVREVMTPRPQVFAVPRIDHARALSGACCSEHNFSRVPVYAGTLDNITGIAFAHDLLQITDEEARTRTVASIQRPAAFVPETKRGYELLREMQREKQHMRIVIDEYGGVAGLVTIEDLLEQIVGDIRDEHENDAHIEDPQREPDGVMGGPRRLSCGSTAASLRRAESRSMESYEATTLGGLVSEIEGRIPLPGEVVLLEHSGLRMEVVASTDRRVDRLRVFPPAIGRSNGVLP